MTLIAVRDRPSQLESGAERLEQSPNAIHHRPRAASNAFSSPYSVPVRAIPEMIVTKPIGIVPRKSE